MKNLLVFAVVLVLLSLVIGVFLYLESRGVELGKVPERVKDYLSGGDSGEEEETETSVITAMVSDSGSDLDGDSVGGGDSSPDIDLPDIDSVECGFYFVEYGVCGGTCPDGECVSNGRSCYCRGG